MEKEVARERERERGSESERASEEGRNSVDVASHSKQREMFGTV